VSPIEHGFAMPLNASYLPIFAIALTAKNGDRDEWRLLSRKAPVSSFLRDAFQQPKAGQAGIQ
jgi:hypothetical protein